jgi:hypothetical protein
VSPLACAFQSKNVQIVEDLLNAGADVAHHTKEQQDPCLILGIPTAEPQIVRMLLKAGADPNSHDRAGRSALFYAAQLGQRQMVQMLLEAGAERDPSAEDSLGTLEFAKAAESPEFQHAMVELEQITQVRAQAVEAERIKGSYYYHILADAEAVEVLMKSGAVKLKTIAQRLAIAEKMRALLDRVQEDFLRRGFYVFDMGPPGFCGDGHLLGLLPTCDKYVVIAAMATNCNDGARGPYEVATWFRKLERDHPFRITACKYDVVEVKFLQPIKDPHRLAKRMYDFCPDMVSQGTQTLDALADQLREHQRAHFWWD